MLTVACPRCKHQLGIPDQFTGEIFRCKQCGSSFRVTPPAPPPGGAMPAGDQSFGLHIEDPPAAPAYPAGSGPGNPLVPASAQSDGNTVRFSCPRCRASFESPASQAGTKFHCSGCGQRIQVPNPPPNKTVLGNVDTSPGGGARPLVPHGQGPQPLMPQPLINRVDDVPVAQYDNTPRMPNISINVNTSQPVLAQPAPQPPPPRPRYRRYEEYPPEPPSGGAATGLGITSMVLGIIALPIAIFPCLGILSLPIAGLAVLLGFLGLALGSGERNSQPGFAIAGLSIGGVAIIIALVWIIALPHYWEAHRIWR
jgi:hypothetical protein